MGHHCKSCWSTFFAQKRVGAAGRVVLEIVGILAAEHYDSVSSKATFARPYSSCQQDSRLTDSVLGFCSFLARVAVEKVVPKLAGSKSFTAEEAGARPQASLLRAQLVPEQAGSSCSTIRCSHQPNEAGSLVVAVVDCTYQCPCQRRIGF